MSKEVKLSGYSYRSDERIEEFVKMRLELEQLIKSKTHSGFSKNDIKLENNVKQSKKRMLEKIIFPSMANLVVFFESLEKHPELRESFEDDMKELFGYIIGPDYDKHKGSEIDHNIIGRLLKSILIWDIKKDPNNFRLDLLNETYKVVWRQLFYILETDQGELPKFVIDDAARIEYWTKLYVRGYVKSGNKEKDQHTQAKRPIQF